LSVEVSWFRLPMDKPGVNLFCTGIYSFEHNYILNTVLPDAISSFDNGTRYVSGPRSTAHIFATYPQPHLSTFGAVIDQVVGTAVLCMGVAAVTDRRNRIPPFLQPTYIGALLAVIGMFLALNAGYAINPARDFGPRLFTLCAGYGWRVFSYRSYKWFWIPILCPMLGGVIGAWIYEFFIGLHIPDDPDTTYIHKVSALWST
uniref:Aquaporin n=1 Tax=Heligmosomoides polygyrus TaxID=6339 RepID=A0A183GDU1_HELPZ